MVHVPLKRDWFIQSSKPGFQLVPNGMKSHLEPIWVESTRKLEPFIKFWWSSQLGHKQPEEVETDKLGSDPIWLVPRTICN